MSKDELLREQVIYISKLLKKPENRLCADCKRPSPSWASMNLGVFVCITCSGCHREIGVHVTKIKSINLDLWPKEKLVHFNKINNKIANKYWEKNLKNFDFKSIQNDNYRLQDFIRDKYERKKWINKKEKDPMTLIIEGEEDSDDDDDDENEEEEEEFVAVEEDDDNDKGAKNKKDVNQENPNLFDFIPGFNAGNNTVNGTQQINNIFVINNQQNAMNNNSNINLLGDYKPETQQDMQRNHLMNNLQQVYTHLNTNYQNTNNAFNQGMPNMNKNNYSNNNFTKNQQQIPSNVLMNNNMNMNTMNTNLVGYQPGMNCNLMNNYSINNKPAIPIYSPNQNTFNIELYNKTKSESNNKQLDNNSNCINKNNFNSNSLRQKKEDDPFKNLVSFK